MISGEKRPLARRRSHRATERKARKAGKFFLPILATSLAFAGSFLKHGVSAPTPTFSAVFASASSCEHEEVILNPASGLDGELDGLHVSMGLKCPFPIPLKIKVDRPSAGRMVLAPDEPVLCDLVQNGKIFRFQSLTLNNTPKRYLPDLPQILKDDIPNKSIDLIEIVLKFSAPETGIRRRRDDGGGVLGEGRFGLPPPRLLGTSHQGFRDPSGVEANGDDEFSHEVTDVRESSVNAFASAAPSLSSSALSLKPVRKSISFGLLIYTGSDRSFWNPLQSLLPVGDVRAEKPLFDFPGVFDRRTVHSHLLIDPYNPLRTFLENPLALGRDQINMLYFEEPCTDRSGRPYVDLFFYHDQPARGSQGVAATIAAANAYPFNRNSYARSTSLNATPLTISFDYQGPRS